MLEISLLKKKDEKKYTEMLNRVPEAFLFHSNLYKELLEDFLSIKSYYIVVKESGRLIGVLPTFIRMNKKYGNIINSLPFFGSNGGFIIEPSLDFFKKIEVKKKLLEGFNEKDVPDPTKPEMIQKAAACVLYGMTRLIKEKVGNTLMAFCTIEPLVSFYPEVGPNAQTFFRKIRKVFDADGLCAPGRQVYTEEEMRGLPDELFNTVNSMRHTLGMIPIHKPQK